MAKRILVPVGPREAEHGVLPLVGAIARDTGATVRLLRVYPIPARVVGTDGRTVAYTDQEMERLDHEGVLELEALVQTTLAGVPVETVVRFGDPASEIVVEAEAFGADLIALTEARHGWLRRVFARHTVDAVARRAPVPALVLKG